MTSAPLRVGTRGSALALWQTEHVRARLTAAGRASERLEIRTTGDLVQHVPLSRIGSRAIFTRQIDDAMLEGRIDLAVHSLKDLPTTLPDGLVLAAVGERDDPRDALVGRGPLAWRDLPRGATLATSSLRRRAQLLHVRPDLAVVRHPGQRGHPAGQARRGTPSGPASCSPRRASCGSAWRGESASGCRPRSCCRRPGQGALAVTARAGDEPADRRGARARSITRRPRVAVAAERAFLRRARRGMPGSGGGAGQSGAGRVRRARAARPGGVAGWGARRSKARSGGGPETNPRRSSSASGSRIGCWTEGARGDSGGGAGRDRARRLRALMPPTVVLTASAGTLPGLVEALRPDAAAGRGMSAADLRSAAGLAIRSIARSTRVGALRRGRAHLAPRRARLRGALAGARGRACVAAAGLGRWTGHGHRAGRRARPRCAVRRPGEVGERGSARRRWRRRCSRPACAVRCSSPAATSARGARRAAPGRWHRGGGDRVLPVGARRGDRSALGRANEPGMLVVASPTVADLLARACPPGVRPALVAVGPTTAAAARASGWAPDAVAPRPTVEALVADGQIAHRSGMGGGNERSLPSGLPAGAGGAAAGVDDAAGRALPPAVPRGARRGPTSSPWCAPRSWRSR